MSLLRYSSPSGRTFERGLRAIERWRTAGAERIVLVGTQKDALLDGLWESRARFYDALRAKPPDLLLGPAWSVYVGESPFYNCFNKSRCLRSWIDASVAGIPTVPAVAYASRPGAVQMAGWLTQYEVPAVFFDMQLVRGSARELLEATLPDFLRSLTRIERIIINGPGDPKSLVQVYSLIRRHTEATLSFTSLFPFRMAGQRQEIFRDRNGRSFRHASTAAPAAIMDNFNSYAAAVVSGEEVMYRPVGMPWSRR